MLSTSRKCRIHAARQFAALTTTSSARPSRPTVEGGQRRGVVVHTKSSILYPHRRDQKVGPDHSYHLRRVQCCRYFSTATPNNNAADSGESKTLVDDHHDNNIHLYDSMTETIQPLSPPKTKSSTDTDDKALAWYTCGPTTYAPAHMGHARTYVWIDIMRRVLEAQTPTDKVAPLFVMNITDVDDKILAAAAEEEDGDNNDNESSSSSPTNLSRRMEAEFWNDLDALHCLRPHVVTRVSEHVESDIVPFVQRLYDLGMAYEMDDGVYFHVRAYNERLGHLTKYGKLAPPAASMDMVITGKATTNNIDNDGDSTISSSPSSSNQKHDPRDFVLWKKRKPGEQLWWSSPFGDGRPGWHIECSAMIEAVQNRFQDTHKFLVHAGGVDLKFPHHSNEIAQSEAYLETGEWILHWVHTGHLHIDGLKMSKSLKNFVSIQEFLAEFGGDDSSSSLEAPADDFRLWCLGLSGKYRGPATFSRTRISEARVIREKVVRFLMNCEERIRQLETQMSAPKIWSDEDQSLFLASDNARKACWRALRNDLDGAAFVEEVVALSDLGGAYLSRNDQGPVELLQAVLSQIRSLLSLVGFSDKTTRAGISQEGDIQSGRYVVGGERAIINSLAEFRSSVRELALRDMVNKSGSEETKAILELCDGYRDSVLPAMGVEIHDGLENTKNSWSFCLPKSAENASQSGIEKASTSVVDLHSVPLADFFKIGQYEGMFIEFTEEGFPVRNADGSEVSKRLRKKLTKKREAHRIRLEQSKADN